MHNIPDKSKCQIVAKCFFCKGEVKLIDYRNIIRNKKRVTRLANHTSLALALLLNESRKR